MRPIEERDLRYVYASYRQAGGDPVDPQVFRDHFSEVAAGALIWVITDPSKDGERPIGVVKQTGNGQAMETHVQWMEWASPRDKITGALTFIDKLRGEQTIMIYGPKSVNRFYEQLARYGVLRRVGIAKEYFPDKQSAHIWQSRV